MSKFDRSEFTIVKFSSIKWFWRMFDRKEKLSSEKCRWLFGHLIWILSVAQIFDFYQWLWSNAEMSMLKQSKLKQEIHDIMLQPLSNHFSQNIFNSRNIHIIKFWIHQNRVLIDVASPSPGSMSRNDALVDIAITRWRL
jgi:hypothetical protein